MTRPDPRSARNLAPRNVCDDNTRTNQPTPSSQSVTRTVLQITTHGVAQHLVANLDTEISVRVPRCPRQIVLAGMVSESRRTARFLGIVRLAIWSQLWSPQPNGRRADLVPQRRGRRGQLDVVPLFDRTFRPCSDIGRFR
jgi:hypothetical protein